MTENKPIAPWYRQPWFWFLTIFPIAAICSGITILTISSSLDKSMVSDDYSKEGRGINMTIARDQKALDLGINGGLSVEGRNASLTLNKAEGPADYPYLIMSFYHPTKADRDRTVQFRRVSDGEYTGAMVGDMDGRWYYDIQGPENDWRVKGELWLPAENTHAVKATNPAQG